MMWSGLVGCGSPIPEGLGGNYMYMYVYIYIHMARLVF